ncbi:hypothetical protein DPMN_188219 [Dreissena polymorpha]|uniref:Uncharacterized protein n=1 Tax=Dreissena polymorpha TaxID=45954 RepID=A0A9D4I9U0_DREPO|nr:hypothetical protein DPMN_188219 [Dreissena polymorpha]
MLVPVKCLRGGRLHMRTKFVVLVRWQVHLAAHAHLTCSSGVMAGSSSCTCALNLSFWCDGRFIWLHMRSKLVVLV